MNCAEAFRLLEQLNAPPRLRRHVELVLEAARPLIRQVRALGVEADEDLVEAGVVLHDIGKTIHPAELHQKGALHEPAGESLLLQHGVAPRLARICRTHADWDHDSLSIEDLLVALADKLWKGARVDQLESRVVTRIASIVNLDRWDVFVPLDDCFEQIAAAAPDRLRRSAKVALI